MCEYCKRIENPNKDIFMRSRAPGWGDEYRNPPECHFCPVCGRALDLSEADPGWIPVSERLPDVIGNYLTSDAYGHVHVMFCTPHLKHPWGITEHDPRFFPVAAWMPLPIPYNEVKHEND